MMSAASAPSAAPVDTGRPAPTIGPKVLHIGSAESLTEHPAGSQITTITPAAAATSQLLHRFDIVVLSPHALGGDAGHRRAVVHTAVQHLDRGGRLMVLHSAGKTPLDVEPTALDLLPAGQHRVAELLCSVFRRGDRFTIHDLVFEARRELRRINAAELQAHLQRTPPPLVLDTRTPSDRARFGTIDGSVHLPRTVIEWRTDPANGYLHPSITGFDQALVVVCNHGYSSSLAAANLQRLGYREVSDLIGGVHAWRAEGFAVVPPDHTFLEL